MKSAFSKILFCAVISGSCGQEGASPIENPVSTKKKNDQAPKRKTYGYQFELSGSLKKANPQALALLVDAPASATAFSIDLTGCDSTHSATVTNTVAYLELYEFDRHCLAKLKSFIFNGITYTPKSGNDFTTWLSGDTATFEAQGANPVDELQVDILNTIPDPVTAGGTVHYQFSDLTKGNGQQLGEADISKSVSLTVDGQASPNFTIRQVKLVNITGTGNGEFRIQLECNQDLTIDPQTGARSCYSTDLSTIEMVLAENTYNRDLNRTDLANIYAGGSGNSIIMIDTGSEVFDPGGGSPALPHGGFITADTGDVDVMVMTGTKPLVSHNKMVFALRSGPTSGPSYTYYFIDVSIITQTGDNR